MTKLPFSKLWSKRLSLGTISLIAVAGVVFILYSTAIAPWVYSDSTVYITTAKNIAAGRGIVIQDSNNLYTLLPFHAPLFPLLLSIPVAVGIDPLQASRWLNAILYGLTIFLASWATYRFTRSFWLSVSVAILCIFSYEPLVAFTGAMAEGLFIFFAYLCLVLIALAVSDSQNQNKLLVFAGISTGLAILARYTGLSVMAVGIVSILLLVKGNFKTRIRQALRFSIPGAILAALWLVPVYFSTHTFGSRPTGEVTAVFDKIYLYFTAFRDVIGSWLPFFYRGNHIITPVQKLILAGVLLVVLLIITAISVRRKGEPYNKDGLLTWGLVLCLFSVSYVGLHLTTYIIAIDRPDINGRLLLPVFYAGVLLAAVCVAFISRITTRTWLGGLAFTALALITIWYFHAKVNYYVFEMHHYGHGYTSNRWNKNLIFDQISSFDQEWTFYSNEPALVLFYTERLPKILKINSEDTAYEQPEPGNEVLVLFVGTAKKDLGEAYDRYINDLKGQYQIVFEDNEGIILAPNPP